MSQSSLVTKELASLLGVLSHPHRVRIIQELRQGERDVNTLQAALGGSHSGASQHLSLLRAHRVVSERRDGRRVLYQLRDPELAAWLWDGLRFLGGDVVAEEEVRTAVRNVRKLWTPVGPRPNGRG